MTPIIYSNKWCKLLSWRCSTVIPKFIALLTRSGLSSKWCYGDKREIPSTRSRNFPSWCIEGGFYSIFLGLIDFLPVICFTAYAINYQIYGKRRCWTWYQFTIQRINERIHDLRLFALTVKDTIVMMFDSVIYGGGWTYHVWIDYIRDLSHPLIICYRSLRTFL